jgi:hypothetical protein
MYQVRGPGNMTARKAVLPFILLLSGMLLAGCIVPVPVPVPVPMPAPSETGQQDLWWMVTPTETLPESSPAALAITEMPTPEPTIPTVTGTPVPVATPSPAPVPVFGKVLPHDTAYAYGDNMDFHAVSVAVGGCQMRTGFYYAFKGYGNRLTRYEASPGNKFLIVEVDFQMTGLLQEGKSSLFMIPPASSFRLVKGAESYGVLNASDIEGMTDYYIRDVGSMYRDQFITKDDDGSGVLIFEVPLSFDPAGAYVTFCPQNPESWAYAGYFRSPDDWDCEKDLVVWQLR